MRQIIHFEVLTEEPDGGDEVGVKIGFNEGEPRVYLKTDDGNWPQQEMATEGASFFVDSANFSFEEYDAAWAEWYQDFVTGTKPEAAPEPETEATIVPEIPYEPDLGAVEVSGDLSTSGDEAIGGIEVSGDMTGSGAEMVAGVGGSDVASGTKKKKKRKSRLREGAGCKQPDEVEGFMADRLLCVTKRHRSTNGRDWGRCEYRVRCNEDGSYTLEYFAGNRTDVKTGDQWQTASIMFKALLALPADTMHHKMTIKRYFKIK